MHSEIEIYLSKFKHFLNQLGSISQESMEAFSSKMVLENISKDQFLTQEGEIENKIYFIISGAIRVYVKNGDKEVSTNFRFENEFTSSITSFLDRSPSQYYLKTLVDTKVLILDHIDLYNLYEEFIEINTLGRVVMERLLIDKRQRELDFLTLPADARYNKLLEDNPEYVLQIPLKYIASFLGITAESLSRIRSKRSVSQ